MTDRRSEEESAPARFRVPSKIRRGEDPDPVHLGPDHADLRSLGAGHLEGFGPDLGDELDDGLPARALTFGGRAPSTVRPEV